MSKNQSGFTLIELLVVLAILGILAAIALTNFYVYKDNAYNATAQSDLRNAINAEEAIYADSNSYVSCIDADDCEAVLPGFKPTRNPDGTSAMQIFSITDNNQSFSGQAKHQNGTKTFQYDSTEGTISES